MYSLLPSQLDSDKGYYYIVDFLEGIIEKLNALKLEVFRTIGVDISTIRTTLVTSLK